MPDLCALSTSCKETSPVNSRFPCLEIDPADDNKVRRTFTPDDYENGLEPGTYKTTYEVCVVEAPTVCEEFEVEYTLTDPCDPPVSVSLASMV